MTMVNIKEVVDDMQNYEDRNELPVLVETQPPPKARLVSKKHGRTFRTGDNATMLCKSREIEAGLVVDTWYLDSTPASTSLVYNTPTPRSHA